MSNDNKKIAITKKGYDVLRIIEINSDHEKCSFKIVPMVENRKLKITATRMFSLPEEVSFDKNSIIELTYHKREGLHQPKIHIKMIDRENSKLITYIDLPLKEVTSPNIKVKIPAPLLQITIPDGALHKKYKPGKDKKEFDIGNNNVVEIFIMNNLNDIPSCMHDFPFIFNALFENNINFFTNGIYRDNIEEKIFNEIGYDGEKCEMLGSQITTDMAIWVKNIYDDKIKSNQVELNFIENKYYIPLMAGRPCYIGNQKSLTYIRDLYFNTMFSDKTILKYSEWFKSQIFDFNRYLFHYYYEYYKICMYYDKIDNHKNEVAYKSSKDMQKFSEKMKNKSYEEVIQYINSDEFKNNTN